MKIALIGYGKMGKMTEEAALARGHEIVSKIDPKQAFRTISHDSLNNADLCIDFSRPEHVLDNIRKAASFGKDIIIGTTGWYEQLPFAHEIVSKTNIGLLYSPNFSLGVNLFYKIVEHAASLIQNFEEYDVGGYEAHHRQKLDAPSGTALKILEILEKHYKNPQNSYASLRCGSIPGLHTVLFDSPDDTIEIKHTARSRKGFASGAITAAEWLLGRKGVYTLDAMF